MIIETITAFVAVKITWETLEILHLLHVGHLASDAGYRGANYLLQGIQKRCQEIQDDKNPAQRLELDAKTLYNYDTPDTNTLKQLHEKAQAYLVILKSRIKNLKNLQIYFEEISKLLENLVTSLLSTDKEQHFLFNLIKLESKLLHFKMELTQFLYWFPPPPRQILYIANLLDDQIIQQFNTNLESIKNCIFLIRKTEIEISKQFTNALKEIDVWLINENLNSASSSLKALPQHIEKCLQNPENVLENVHVFLPNETKLAKTCANIIKVFSEFQKIPKAQYTNQFEDDPAWFPLLTPAEQTEVGQRIFLHAMNETKNSEEEKLWFAQIFLRKPAPQHGIKKEEVEKMAYEMACVLRAWQIEKCDRLIAFLDTLKQGTWLPITDPDGLITWLKTKKKEQNPFALFKEILVIPCCFSECSIDSALDQLNRLSLAENPTKLIKKHWGSYWGAIWKNNDALVQLPKAFHTDIFPDTRAKQDSPSQNPNKVSPLMYELATALMADLERLKTTLKESKSIYFAKMSLHEKNRDHASEEQKKQIHELGVTRVKKAQLHTSVISSPASHFYPYLFDISTINEEEKKLQVPTVDDLIQLIYLGLEPNGSCNWKRNSANDSITNQLAYYFIPGQLLPKPQDDRKLEQIQKKQKNDPRTKAWIYACTECQINVVPAFAYLFSTERFLALEGASTLDVTVQNALSIQAILKNPNKKLSLVHSKALNGVPPEMVKQTEVVFQQLQDYYLSALVRVKPEYLTALPYKKQIECVITNLFKFGQEIGEERLESARIYIGDFCTVLSQENLNAINFALDNFRKTYIARFAKAKAKHNAHSSQLYKLMEKAMNGPVTAILEQMHPAVDLSDKQVSEKNPKEQTIDISEEKVQTRLAEANKETKKAREETANERKEKEAAQAEIENERKKKEAAQAEIENERKEKEAAQAREAAAKAEIERLKELLALINPEQVSQPPPAQVEQLSLGTSCATLFSASNVPSVSTNTVAEHRDLTEYRYAP